MDALLRRLDKLLTRKVCDAATKALEKLAQAFNRQQKFIADLREEVRSLGERMRVLPDREPSLSRIRLSAHDIKVFRKRRHLTQEVFAQMLHVSKPTVRRRDGGARNFPAGFRYCCRPSSKDARKAVPGTRGSGTESPSIPPNTKRREAPSGRRNARALPRRSPSSFPAS